MRLDVVVKYRRGRPLIPFCGLPSFLAPLKQDSIILTLLVSKGVDVHARDAIYREPLLFAAMHGHLATVQKLLRWSTTRPITDYDEVTCPLWAALKGGHGRVALELMKSTDDWKHHLSDAVVLVANSVLLHKGVSCGSLEVVEMMLRELLAIDVEDVDEALCFALSTAIEN